MKIMEAIRRVDELKANTYTIGEKIAWLSEIDGNVKKTIYDTHIPNVGDIPATFSGYTEESVEDGEGCELLIPAPWDSVYIYWLQAQMDFYNNEMERYNNSIAAVNSTLQTFENHYHRTHSMTGTAFNHGGVVL